MKSTDSPRRRATRLKLFDAAVDLIAEQGFSATTVDGIAERAGVSKGTVYYNFTGKTELYEELLRHNVGMLASALRGAAAECRSSGGDTREALNAIVRAGLRFTLDHPALVRLYLGEVWRTHSVWHPTVLAVRRRAHAAIEEQLRLGAEAGELRPDTDVRLAASALAGALLVAALDWRSFAPEVPVEEVERTLGALLPTLRAGQGLGP
ncbi:TetR family transcriptional regulator [Streptomyces alkaliphilus]|uniref:TetR family transcriptional regulator n=1 Tax=Streptomyces alkaliphilus TaxID=1472722 RepID=A0A7W3THS1_9ACTN|nr:TetR/AcrR family transcriptional regulator [Streptomyces alkaliphilus]MBB0247071.1 TetR family transcriptional regulator [Streptomyces alkaliphilus]